MYQRGYVENVPGAPMCGCVEQMPTGEFAYVSLHVEILILFVSFVLIASSVLHTFPVTRSDCTQVDLTETIEVTYKADTNTFTSKLCMSMWTIMPAGVSTTGTTTYGRTWAAFTTIPGRCNSPAVWGSWPHNHEH